MSPSNSYIMCLQSQEKEKQQKSLIIFEAYTGNIVFSDYLNEHCCLPTHETYHDLELPVLENTLKCVCHLSSWILGFDIPQPAIVRNCIELIQTLRIPVVVCGATILGSTILLFPKSLQSADLIIWRQHLCHKWGHRVSLQAKRSLSQDLSMFAGFTDPVGPSGRK